MTQRVLIAPLHWGLGHATRCVPVIQQQLDAGNKVIVSAISGPRHVIEERFPDLEFIDLPFMEITYPKDGNMARHFFWKSPQLLASIWREHRLLQKLIDEKKIDVVISDSRFGLWSNRVKSIFITHQVQILSPKFQSFINFLNRWVMSKYDEVWIPDYDADPGLAGILSHPPKMPRNAKYVGPLSRFSEKIVPKKPIWKAVVIISGPEPQRALFEAEMARRFIESDEPALILRGKPTESKTQEIGNLKIMNHLNNAELIEALAKSEVVISRSGYSSIMDYEVLGIKAELHPTLGQTEQEYLAELHQN